MANPIESLPPEVVDAWRRGRKIEAIKLLREKTGAGLAEAKAVVEALAAAKMEGNRSDGATVGTVKALGTKIADLGPGHETLSPGEVPRAKGGPWLFVVLALVLLAVWVAFKLD